MSRKCYSTFDPWIEYEEGEPMTISIEDLEPDYQSTYVTKYNHLREAGWVKRRGYWISPYNPEGIYPDIWKAHQSQELWEIQNGTLDVHHHGSPDFTRNA